MSNLFGDNHEIAYTFYRTTTSLVGVQLFIQILTFIRTIVVNEMR